MLKPDQVVNVTANDLQYDGQSSKAVYSGNSLLWQGETSIKAATIIIDDKSGDMSASGKVVTKVSVAADRSALDDLADTAVQDEFYHRGKRTC